MEIPRIEYIRSYLPRDPNAIAATACVVGILSSPFVFLLTKYCIRKIREFSEWLNRQSPVVHMRSLNCNLCAQNHLNHMNAHKIQRVASPKFNHAPNIRNSLNKSPLANDIAVKRKNDLTNNVAANILEAANILKT